MTLNLSANTFKVTYEDGEQVLVKPVSWKLLEDIETLTKEIFIELLEVNGNFGQLFKASNRRFWGNAEKLAKIMPIVGYSKEENPGLNLEKIENIDQLVRIFITTSEKRDKETGGVYTSAEEPLPPSEIYRINSLDFFFMIGLAQKENQKKQKRRASRKTNS